MTAGSGSSAACPAQHGLRVYATDAAMAAHDGRITRHEAPFLSELLERDRMFTDRLHQEARRLDLPVIEISTAMTEDGLARRVTEVFGL